MKTQTPIDINELTLGQLKEIQSLTNQSSKQDDSHWEVGKAYFIRLATYHVTGVLTKVTPSELVLRSAAWIADSGRFAQAVETGTFEEVEPFPENRDVIINRMAIIDGVRIPQFPTSQK